MPSLSALRHRPAVRWFADLVAAAGIALTVWMVSRHGLHYARHETLTFVMLTAGIVLGEFRPIKIPRRGDDEEITVSSSFAFALLLTGGLPAALVAQSVASLVQDIASRKALWRAIFNVGQYALSLGAAMGVMRLVSDVPHLGDTHQFSSAELVWVLLGAAVFFTVNAGIVGVAIALYQRVPIGAYFRKDIAFSAMTGGVLLCLAPIVVAAVDYAPALLPLFLCPLLAIYRAGQEATRSEQAARTDSLTKLANRASFSATVERTIAEGGRSAILLMDVNRFKEINDTLGHHYGDQLLCGIADRLRASMSDATEVSRLGGDEFAVLVTGMAAYEDGTAVAQRIADAFEKPFEVADFVVEAEASIGIALHPDDGTDVDTLLQRADVAMYHAKDTHKPYTRYAEEHDHHSPARLALMADLRGAIDAGQMVLWYQPALDLATGTVSAVEALVRWDHPELGLLPPSAFIDMAERTSLIKPLTTKVLGEAMRQAAEWEAQGMPLVVAVNVSMRSLVDREFPQHVRELLSEHGIDARLIKLEITESAIMADPEVVGGVLAELDAIGVRLSIDDFGTGYSSLAYLKDLPVHEVKIDRSFISGMAEGTRDAVIVHSTIDLGHRLGLQVVAEGVEEVATLESLAELGCDLAQGYGISRPLPAPRLWEWLRRSSPSTGMSDVAHLGAPQ